MQSISGIRRVCICALCIALCYVLPILFHTVAAGPVLAPMHIPVLLCGLVCGSGCGVICGLFGPILSSVLTGMPPVTALITMIPELCTYGFVSGLLMQHIRTNRSPVDVYCALIPAMILGRIAGGLASAAFYLGTTGVYTMSMWAGTYLITSLPGILVHLILVPSLYLTLTTARVIPVRYPKTAC